MSALSNFIHVFLKQTTRFLRNWTLPTAIACGIAAYLVYHSIPSLSTYGPLLEKSVHIIQPALLFIMLFLSFCRISPSGIRLRKWHLKVLAVQALAFISGAVIMRFTGDFEGKLLIEGAMLCIICPTATAAAVITGKLGGDVPGVITYTIIINLAAALIIPLTVPLIHPSESVSFLNSFATIMAKVFPLLIAPLILAFLVRYGLPRFHRWLLKFDNLAFYIWGISLALAIAMTTRSLMNSTISIYYKASLGAVSLACCILQFVIGKKIGGKYGDSVTGGQSLGQKNTVFAIWTGYTFLTPVTSVAAGFYCIWHNLFNSWQLYRQRKRLQRL